MPSILSPLKSPHESLRAISYEQVKPGKPPLPIVSAPRPSSAHGILHPSLRNSSIPSDAFERKRDSGYTSSVNLTHVTDSDSNGKEQSLPSSPTLRNSQSLRKSQSLPRFSPVPIKHARSLKRLRMSMEPKPPMAPQIEDQPPRLPEISLPEGDSAGLGLDDMTEPGGMEFSKRGSLYLGGQRPAVLLTAEDTTSTRATSTAFAQSPPRILSTDEEALSKQVRSMYEVGGMGEAQAGPDRLSFVSSEAATTVETRQDVPQADSSPSNPATNDAPISPTRASFLREDKELAGGIEDWQDVDNEDVDRYGFIIPKNSSTTAESDEVPPLPQPGIHRIATSLKVAADSPRRSRSKIGRNPAALLSSRSLQAPSITVNAPKRPASSQNTYPATRSLSVVRSATNRLPYNRDRRYMDEAGDMLTLSPQAVAEDSINPPTSKKKEWSREEKWRKMAKVTKPKTVGGLTQYEFDTKDPKVISRTWKGIPDRWRATAWHSFLSASAKRYPHSSTDAELITAFNELVLQSSPDDFQIDLDVPRTISSHIMFRRRYRGGQRLLFRLLHALSLYFPDTGYVQGMAPLAATFLCYFEEEMAFVMLVRLWQTRGLNRLYEHGFVGLMDALNEFEKYWLAGGAVDAKLTELDIAASTFGTRWYLTVFNYAIPFPAQLRVWDIFLLLGDADTPIAPKSPPSEKDTSFHGGLDILHATAAALIDGIRDILLESDFENAMKTLTSWIPIRDEDVLMNVTRAEWKLHCRRKK